MKLQGNLDVNYRYFINFVEQLPDRESIKVLDYGCGNGILVEAMRKVGVDCYGVDLWGEGVGYSPEVYSTVKETCSFKSGFIKRLSDNCEIPFPEHYFDVVISNQVFEHIKEKGVAFANISKILKKNGIMLHHFPTKEYIWEGHMHIPFVHRLPIGKFRLFYTSTLRFLGMGIGGKGRKPMDWAEYSLKALDETCFYLDERELRIILSKEFEISHKEIEYMLFRAQANKQTLIKALLKIGFMKPVYEAIFRKLAFSAIFLRKNPLKPVIESAGG